MPRQLFDDLPELRLEIDEFQLVEEWMGQPQLMLEWSEHYANAVHDTDRAKAALEVAKAEADREIRESPAEFGLTKATETTVPGAVLEQAAVKAKTKAYHAAKHRQAVLGGAVAAIEDRRRALQKIVDLHGQEYYSTPNAPTPKGVRSRKKRGADDDD